jgi:hypothetical protein
MSVWPPLLTVHVLNACAVHAPARRERPRGSRRATKQRDELASFQLIESHPIPASQGRIAGYRIGEDQSGDNGTILQPV